MNIGVDDGKRVRASANVRAVFLVEFLEFEIQIAITRLNSQPKPRDLRQERARELVEW